MDHEQSRKLHASSVRVVSRWAIALGLIVALVIGFGLLLVPSNGYAKNLPPPLRDWPKPDVAIVVSGQMHGYIGPCGCSHPQYGGLVRRYNFIELLKKKGWPVVGLDLGELPQTGGIKEQGIFKLHMTMSALNLMGYRAVGIGKYELGMPLTDFLAAYSLNHPNPRPLAANLADAAAASGLYHQLNARPWEIIADIKPRLGVLSLIGKDLQAEFKEEYLQTGKALKDALLDFATGQVELGVVMYQEYPKPPKNLPNQAKWVEEERHTRAAACASFCAAERKQNPRVPPIGLILSLTDEPEPPGQLHDINGSSAKLLEIGHKGRYIGVVGVYRRGDGFELKYQLVSIDPDFDEPADPKAKNPVLDLMEQYARQVEKEKLLAKSPRTPHHTQIDPALLKRGINARFVGNERCEGCHEHAAEVWAKTRHAHAFQTLVDATKPFNRQHDPECVVCHTVGFRHPTGYYDPPDKGSLPKHNAKLENVGCESCHGPGSAHAANPNDVTLYPLINPYRASEAERAAARDAANPNLPPAQQQQAQTKKTILERQRYMQLDFFCQRCHDTDNDVNWSKVSFAEKWIGGRIEHMTPRPGNQAGQPQKAPALPTGRPK